MNLDYSALHVHQLNMFAIPDSGRMFGMRINDFDNRGLKSNAVLTPSATVRFCINNGDVVVSDMILATYSIVNDSARGKIEEFLTEEADIVRGLGMVTNNTLEPMVRVATVVLVF